MKHTKVIGCTLLAVCLARQSVVAQTATGGSPQTPVVPQPVSTFAATPQVDSPARFVLALGGALVADGASSGTLVITGYDRWGHPARKDAPVTVTVSSGSLLLREANADPSKTLAAERVESKLDAQGQLTLNAYATMIPGSVSITAISDGAVTQGLSSANFYVEPYIRNPVVIGLASAGIGSVPGDVDGSDFYDNGDSNKGRVAFYASGKVADKTSATFAYETANRLNPSYTLGQYTLDPNERPYLTYGDNSTRSVDALSQGHFFGRLDRGRSSLMYGEFDAQTDVPSSVGTFQGLLSGYKLHLSDTSGNNFLNAFTASDNVAFARRVFNPLGLSNVTTALGTNLIVGSDVVTLVALDRHSGAIVSQTTFVRNVDYAINYSSGEIRFITIPLPYDANFNPQVIVAQYQLDGTGRSSRTTGGSGQISLGRAAFFEAGYANNVQPGVNQVVTSQRLHGSVGSGNWTVYHASTDQGGTYGPNARSNTGDNVHVDFNVPSGADRYFALYDWTSPNFYNFFGGFATNGLIDERAGWEHRFTHDGLLTLQFTRDSNQQGANQNALGAVFKTKPSPRFGYTVGFFDRTANGQYGYGTLPYYPYPANNGNNSPPYGLRENGTVVQGEVGANWQATSRVTLSADQVVNFGNAVGAFPAQTSAEVAYGFPHGHAYLRELWTANPTLPLYAGGGSGSSITGPLYGFASLAQATHATVLGVSRDIGPMTSIDTGYVVQQTNNGTDAYTTYGVKQRFIMNNYLQGDAFLQSGQGFGQTYGQNSVTSPVDPLNPTQSTFTVFGVNLAYDKAQRVRSALSFQDRLGFYGGTTLNLGASGRISPEFALAAAVNSTRLNTYSTDDNRIGLAWRPSNTNRVAALLQYESYNGLGTNFYFSGGSGNAQVVSYDQLYRPTSTLELAGKVAYKLDGDSYYLAHTGLLGLRAQQRIGPKADIAAEWQWLSTAQIGGISQTAFAAELGYRIGSSLRIAGGYNFSGSADPSLTGRPTRQGLYLTGTSTIDRIFGWGRFVPSSQPDQAQSATVQPEPASGK